MIPALQPPAFGTGLITSQKAKTTSTLQNIHFGGDSYTSTTKNGFQVHPVLLDECLAYWKDLVAPVLAQKERKQISLTAYQLAVCNAFQITPQAVPPALRWRKVQAQSHKNTHGPLAGIAMQILQELPPAEYAEDAIGQLEACIQLVSDLGKQKAQQIEIPESQIASKGIFVKGGPASRYATTLYTLMQIQHMVLIAPNGGILIIRLPKTINDLRKLVDNGLPQQGNTPDLAFIHQVMGSEPIDLAKHIQNGNLKVEVDKAGQDKNTVLEWLAAHPIK